MEIQKLVPLPSKSSRKKAIDEYIPIAEAMEVGDSVYFEAGFTPDHPYGVTRAFYLTKALKTMGRSYTTRGIKEGRLKTGYRVWRTS